MGKKIALMTWHHAENYGTAFQAYALSRLIERADCSVTLIDYRRLGTPPLKQRSSLYIFKRVYNGIMRRVPKRKKRRFLFPPEVFGHFYSSFFAYTHRCNNNQDFNLLNNQYDGFVCGSDQIWGPEWFDARFFFDFVKDNNRKIAYAPSLGVSEIRNENVRREIANLVSLFPHLSVREQTGCSLIESLLGRNDCFNAIDPVLMLTAEEWSFLEDNSITPCRPYVLIFFLKNNTDNIRRSMEFAAENGCTPLVLHCTQSEDTEFANVKGLTPEQLLSYIHHARYICTDSFHVMVLSIIFNRQFKIFKKEPGRLEETKSSRIEDLLRKLDIMNCYYEEDTSFSSRIDYQHVEHILFELRKESFRYLLTAIDSLPILLQDAPPPMRCEKVASANGGWCIGEQCAEFLKRGKKQNCFEHILYNRMISFPFSLQTKCYRCGYYKSAKVSDCRKPLFYSDILKDLEDEKISLVRIFLKYYMPYFFNKKKNDRTI